MVVCKHCLPYIFQQNNWMNVLEEHLFLTAWKDLFMLFLFMIINVFTKQNKYDILISPLERAQNLNFEVFLKQSVIKRLIYYRKVHSFQLVRSLKLKIHQSDQTLNFKLRNKIFIKFNTATINGLFCSHLAHCLFYFRIKWLFLSVRRHSPTNKPMLGNRKR